MVEMDSFGVIRRIIEFSDSSESEEDPDLERAIQLSLQPPDRPAIQPHFSVVERPTFRALYDQEPAPAKPAAPRRVRPPPTNLDAPNHSESRVPNHVESPPIQQPARPRPPTMPKPCPPPLPPNTYGLPMNPQIIVYPGVWPPPNEPPSTAVIEDVTDLFDESRYTGEVVTDGNEAHPDSRSADRWAGSSRDPR